MPPLLSISIIAFYLSILISLVIHFQLVKKDEKFSSLGCFAIFIPATISYFLLLNYTGLKTLLAGLPLFVFGLYSDLKAEKPNLIGLSIANLLSSAFFLLITRQLSLSLLLLFTSIFLNYSVKPKKHIEALYAIFFSIISLLAHGRVENLLKLTVIMAVSTTGIALTNIKKIRIRLGYCGIYLVNFISAFVLSLTIIKLME